MPALVTHDALVMPKGRIGKRVRSIIATVNADDPETVRRFVERECTESFKNSAPMQVHQDAALNLRRQSGGIEFCSIRTYTPPRVGQTVVILRGHNFNAWRAITLRFDQANDDRINHIVIGYARPPSNIEEPALTEDDVLDVVRDTFRRVSDRDVFSGALLIARDDQVLLTLACGEASKRFNAPNNIDTKFNLGSISKMFTATAIAQLVERGDLAYDDPISRHVDASWLSKDITDKVTIHHLLSHTSGLGDYFNDTYWKASRENYRSVEDFKPLVQDEQLQFEPGAGYRYSNTGMLLLGVVIERATQQSYFDYIREHVYEPAGMTHTDSFEMDSPVENLAIGYVADRDSTHGWRNNLFKHVIKGGPAGGGFSTVGDLHSFARALQTNMLISAISRDRLWLDSRDTGYGYGFGVEEGAAGKVVGHAGGFPGVSGNLDLFCDSGYVVAVLANYCEVARLLAGRIKQLIGRLQHTR